MGEVFLDAFIDTLLVLPFLLAMNFLIELVEYKTKGLKANKILKGGCAPLIGTAVGVVPQCGFSVVATELYAKRRIALGTLFAVYLATSDEALPIMISSIRTDNDVLLKIVLLLAVKVGFALAVGYAVFLIEKLVRRAPAPVDVSAENEHEHEHEGEGEHDDVNVHIHGCHHHSLEAEEQSGPLTKKQKAAHVWRVYLKHPLLHTATVILFIFAVNIAFGIAVYFIGEARISGFISSTGYLQPVFAGIVGLIPNCAASVVITELYVVGGLNLGGAVAGLCVSAGIGYAVLIKENRPLKNTVLVIALMYGLSVAFGVVLTAIGL